jgi:hypothetical protein
MACTRGNDVVVAMKPWLKATIIAASLHCRLLNVTSHDPWRPIVAIVLTLQPASHASNDTPLAAQEVYPCIEV